MAKRISTLPLPHFLKTALADAGYQTVSDFSTISASDLVTELSIGLDQATEVLKLVTGSHGESSQLHDDSLQSSQSAQIQSAPASSLLPSTTSTYFTTFSHSIDSLIGRVAGQPRSSSDKGTEWKNHGSVSLGMSVEISGPPGIGKTAAALGLAMSARLARLNEGEKGEVLIVDTEGGITPERLNHAMIAVTRHTDDTPSETLRGIHLLRIVTQVQMIAFLNTMSEWLDEHPKVDLVIIDTLSFHFRQPTLDMKTRARVMDIVKHQLGKITTIHHCAVVIVNQVATKLLTAENKPATFDTGDRAILMPQLGDSWTLTTTIKLVLFRGGDQLRYAHVSAPSEDVPWAQFDIDVDGLCIDLPTPCA